MNLRNLLASGALAAVAVTALGSAANAYTINADGQTGFIGKGEVQSALGLNNKGLQDGVAAKSFVFTGTQSTSQSLDQDGTQAGTQSAVQSLSQDLTCTFTNGNATKVFHRDGERAATRDAGRDAERTGTRTGTRVSTFGYDLDVDARKGQSQYTGFILKGVKQVSSSTNPDAYGAWGNFGEWAGIGAFVADEASTVWGEWDALPGENPDDCLRSANADKITQISNVIDVTSTTEGAFVADDPEVVSVTKTTEGPVVTGALALFVNNKAL